VNLATIEPGASSPSDTRIPEQQRLLKKIMCSPRKYVQGPGVLREAGLHANELGSRAIVLGDNIVLSLFGDILSRSFQERHMTCLLEEFHGECSHSEIDRLSEIAKRMSVDLVVGVGGGKALDTAKAVAHRLGVSMAMTPTIASTDAPTSSVSVIYDENHMFSEALYLHRNPDLVLVDTEAIAKAPVRFLIAGIGDALSKKYEVEACFHSSGLNMHNAHGPLLALELARLTHKILVHHALSAKRAAEKGTVTQSLETVVEAIILYSGLAFENGGLAAAHSIADGLTFLERADGAGRCLHGELVAFGTIVQLVLERRPRKLLDWTLGFCRSLGLPTTLTELGAMEVKNKELMEIARRSCLPGKPIHNMNFQVTPKMVRDAILVTDTLGTSYTHRRLRFRRSSFRTLAES
jgi:glycerol dehydrogenase